MSSADSRPPRVEGTGFDGPEVDTLVTPFDPAAEGPGEMESILVVLKGPDRGRTFALSGATQVIGRDPKVDVHIADPGLSRAHARINRTPHGEYIEDLGSTNGTLVNGERLKGFHALQEADLIQLGSEIMLRFGRRDRLEHEAAQRLYERSVRDALTGLYNRHYLNDRLPGELAYARRHDVDLCVLILDVDHFKQINDTRGHAAGDAVLQELARCFEGIIRKEDVLARHGGEEFAVVALGIDLNGGLAFGERLRASVQALRIEWEGTPVPVTVSIGVAHNRTSDQHSMEGLFAAADNALYEAKRRGRNRVCADEG